jgi:hypothetical protein
MLLAAVIATALPLLASAGQPSADAENLCELFRLRIVNERAGDITISRDGGHSWRTLGRVTRHAARVNERGFTASKWVQPGCVSGAAVNAIHVTTAYRAETDRGVLFSLLPSEFGSLTTDFKSFLSPDSSIYTDIPAGDAIFGGGEAPFVGNSVYREEEGSALAPLPQGYVPVKGDVLVILVERPALYPYMAVFENVPGGTVTLHYPDGSRRLLGWVVWPVRGIGRFAGTRYSPIGRIRANHPGVLDISTSPVGRLGGFQIIPVRHALSPEMKMAWDGTQWMIVGPASDDTGLWSGPTALFYHHVRPDYRPDDLHRPDWQQCLLARFLVELDFGDGWRPMPALHLAPNPNVPLPQWADHALEHAKSIRILFPLADRSDIPGGST